MKFRISLTALAFVLYILPLLSQTGQYQFVRLDISEGLSHNQINCILKDSRGFLWFGTMSGLNRYDGYTFKTFHHKQGDSASLSDDFISNILEGPGGKLFIDTRNGQNLFDPVTEKFSAGTSSYLTQLSLPQAAVTDIVKDRQGHYWFVQQQNGVSEYDPVTGKVKKFVNRPGDDKTIATNNITGIAITSKDDVWIVHSNGIVEMLDRKTAAVTLRSNYLFKQDAEGFFAFRLFADADDDLWIYVSTIPHGVFYFKPGSNTWDHFDKNSAKGRLNTGLVTGVTQDNKGIIWISTDHGGINLLDKKNFNPSYLLNNADDEKSISQNSITDIYRDNTGTIWMGTFKKGINYYHEGILKFPVYRHQPSVKESLPYNDVNRFVEDDKGNIWIGTNGGGLIYYDRQSGHFRQFRHNAADNNSISNDVIVSLCIDHEKKLWIGSYFGGLDCYDGKKFTHYKHNPSDPRSLTDNRVWEIYEDKKHRLWVGTLGGGLDRFDRGTETFYHYKSSMPNSISSDFISSITEDAEGNLWIGTAYGVNVLKPGTGNFSIYSNIPGTPGSISNNNIIVILEDSFGRVWTGTRDGLNFFNKSSGTFRIFRTEDGLPSNTILTILEDNSHNLWITTPNGVSKAVVKDSGNNRINLQFRNFDERDGLQGREFNENAALKTQRGELIVGGANGFNIITPERITHNMVVPKVVLTGFRVFDKNIEAGELLNNRVVLEKAISEAEEIILRYHENVFSLEFAALSFSNPEKNNYRYMLEGFNKVWLATDGRQRRVTYTNLDPGEYFFRVKASNDDGVWNEEGVLLRIVVLPPFWKTWPAFILYALVIAGILLFARRLTIQSARMRFQLEQQKSEAERLHELDMMKLKFFTNVSHEFRTPLSLILAPVEKMEKQSAEPVQKKQLQLIHRNAKRLLGLVNQLLDFRKLEMQELKLYPSQGDIVSFVKELTLSFTDVAEKKNINFSFHATMESLEASFDPDKVERIMFNLLSNAFKFTREQGSVSVSVDQKNIMEAGKEEKFAEIKIKDTGIGIPKEKQEKIFERFFQHDTPGSLLNQGSGIGLAISKEFIRLHHGMLTVDSEPDKGTCFTVLLPVQSKAVTVAGDTIINTASEEEAESADTEKKQARRKPSILVVDDNDDIRFYLKDNLRSYYSVYEAVNGREAWQQAQQHQPDLVVSDIMMPEMDGIELCRKIKNDPRTSHIPVILLTARSAEEQKLEGFETGASDYITKPFSFEILQSRIKNLLAQQEAFRKLFQKQIEVNPGDISVSSVDEQFIRQALEAVEKRIADPEFTVEDLSRAMHMSRVALYKKLLSLTGKTPLDFIRSIRMKRAAQLLEKSRLTVSEIAYEVGFNNPKYFAKFFKKEFNVLPSEYISEKRRKTNT